MLRTRLFLNLVPFVVILLAVGVYAVVLFTRLAGQVDVTVKQSYESVAAVHAMRLAARDIETGLRIVAEGEPVSGARFFHDGLRTFDQNLTLQLANMELPGEGPLTRKLQTEYSALRDAGEAMLTQTQARERQRLLGQALSRLVPVHELLEEIRVLNHDNILATSRNIGEITSNVTRLMNIGMAIALIISAYACYQLGKSILRPIQMLTRAAHRIGEGDLDQTVPVLTRDELGQLATAFNKMAAQLKAYRQSTTEKIVRLHRTMESTLASFPDPIFVLNRTGRIELKNPAAEELSAQLGLTDSLPERLQETADEVLRHGNDFLPNSFKDVVSYRVNGQEKFLLPRVLTMRGEDRNPVGVAVVLYDVTRFRLLDDAKSNLVATVSHELKTPLTSVRMVLHLLLEKTFGPLTPRQDELLETARKDAERLLRILNDLLDLARLDAGTTGLNLEAVAPAALVHELVTEFEPLVAQQGLRLGCLVRDSLPEVLVDRQRIAHVFRNFISNAIKHSPPGGEIGLRVMQTDNGGVQFSVTDQGPGVPEEYQGRIFERFFRVPGQQKTGAGLGLSIAREITIAHGGRIGVRSEPGKGSEFYVVLATAEEMNDSTADRIPAARRS